MPKAFSGSMVLVLVLSVSAACTGPTNPSFDVSVDEAREAIRAMRDAPAEPVRPIVVVGPFLDPAIAEWQLRRQVSKAFEPNRVVGVSFAFWSDFDACRTKVIEAVESAYPSDDPAWTTEVDVIAFSMGGLVARYAAADPITANTEAEPGQPSKRLKIARLYTVCSPHQGSGLAQLPSLLPLVRAMKPGSSFLERMDAELEHAGYELTAYTRLYDPIVHPTRAAPAGQPVRWVPNRLFSAAHVSALRDPRVMADILRRLRNEPPLSSDPPEPLPG